MRGDANAVPLESDGLEDLVSPLRAQAHVLIDVLPAHVLVAILPVLQKYSGQPGTPDAPAQPDANRMTIHHR